MGRLRTLWLAAVAALFLALGGSASADPQSLTLAASADTTVQLLAPSSNFGGADTLSVQPGAGRALVRVDEAGIADAVGSGRLLQARLVLQLARPARDWGAAGRPVSLHRLTADWAEGNGVNLLRRGSGPGATWSCATDAQISNLRKDCSGATAWDMLRPAAHPWAEPATATATIVNGQTGAVAFDVTADVRSFLAGSAANDGWIVTKDQELLPGEAAFGSRESAAGPTLVLDVETSSTPTMDLTQPYDDPTLTPDQESAAVAATQTDPSFDQLVSGLSYQVGSVEAWGKDTHPGLEGAIVNVTLDQPAEISGSWPELTYTSDAVPYTTQSFDLDLKNVTGMSVYVDLATGSVVGIDPNPDATWAGSPQALTHAARAVPFRRKTAVATAVEQEDAQDVGTGRATNALHVVCPDQFNCFMNFDFGTSAKDQNRADWSLADWPVTTLWTGQSNIDLVKTFIDDQLAWFAHGSAMAAAIQDGSNGSSWSWDTDKGKKEQLCTWHFKTPHTRLYAPSSTDYLWSPRYGFYVLGTTHYDWGECLKYSIGLIGGHYGGAGYSESVERLIAKALTANGYDPYLDRSAIVMPETIPLRNAEHFTHGDHVADNDGVATEIEILANL